MADLNSLLEKGVRKNRGMRSHVKILVSAGLCFFESVIVFRNVIFKLFIAQMMFEM
jgi:hypothetical protein